MIKNAALGLKKNYKNKSERAKTDTYDFQVKIAENFSGQTFALFLKHLNELKRDVILYNEKEGIEIQADSFLVFLDKMRNLTHSPSLNSLIMTKISDINIELLNEKQLLNTF